MANVSHHDQPRAEIPKGGTAAERDTQYPSPPNRLMWWNTDLVEWEIFTGVWRSFSIIIAEEEGFVRKRADGSFEAIKTNLTATTDPAVTDDDGDGYMIGSRWINTSAGTEFVCVDASTGAASWVDTTLTGASHTIASHSDTTATGAELETLTDGSDADALHDHTNHGVTHNAAHDILSTSHPDSLAGTVVRGDLLVVNSTPRIARVALGAAGAVPTSDGSDTVLKVAKRSAIFPIEGLLPNATAGYSPPVRRESSSNGVNYAVGTFAANEQGSRGMPLPKNYDGGTVTWWYYWISPTGSSADDTVIMQLKGGAFDDGDAIDTALGTGIAITDTVLTGAGRKHMSAESSALTIAGSPAGLQWVIFELERTGGTMSEEVEILAVYVRYGTNDYSDE